MLEEIVLDFRAKGTTILFSTHLMDQAERLCERVCLISKSRKMLDADMKELKAAERGGVVAVEFEGPDAWIAGPEVASVKRVNGGLHRRRADGANHGMRAAAEDLPQAIRDLPGVRETRPRAPR